jgi:hypothetical protein
MADDNDTTLTRYTSAVTIVTADVMNKLYGGEFGFNNTVDAFHPLVAGHVHDGTHANGRASKVLLTDGGHVRGQLAHANLGGFGSTTPAVQYINVQSYSDLVYGSPAARRAAAIAASTDLVHLAIPEFIENTTTGEKNYYLDLSLSAGGVNTNVQFNNAGAFGGNNGFVYDYTNTRVGIGTAAPARRLHIEDAVNPPIRVVGIPSGSGGTPLGVDANGDFYTDVAIGAAYTADGQGIELAGSEFSLEIDVSGDIVLSKSAAGITALNDAAWWNARKIQGVAVASPLAPNSGDVLVYDGVSEFVSQAPAEQNLFSIVTVAGDGGTASGGPVVADSATDTLNLTAGAGITLTATAGSDTVKIAADAPSGVPTTTATQVMPHNLCSHGANPSDDKIFSGTGAAAGDVCALSKNYSAAAGYASFPVAVPKNASGANPASFVVTTAWVGKGAGGDGAIATRMSYSDSGGIDVQIQGDPFSFTWAVDDEQTPTVGNLKVGIATHASVALATSATGYIHIRIGRNGEVDEYGDEVHLIYCQIEWTW